MPFTSYSTIGDAAQAFNVRLVREEFIEPLQMAVPEPLRADLEFALRYLVFDASETAVCENLIFPILREVWKPHLDVMTLWSHVALNYTPDLSGIADYL